MAEELKGLPQILELTNDLYINKRLYISVLSDILDRLYKYVSPAHSGIILRNTWRITKKKLSIKI